MESVSELRMLSEVGTLDRLLQHTMIFTMIVKALESDDGSLDLDLDSASKQDTPQTKPHKSATIKDATQSNELPPHKLFGAFISHKKASWL